jgi:hypothetical protein
MVLTNFKGLRNQEVILIKTRTFTVITELEKQLCLMPLLGCYLEKTQ